MKIYVSHCKGHDFFHELYVPLRNSVFNSLHEIILPHEESLEQFSSKKVIPTCDLVLAEVSYPATGVGMELGWANVFNVPVICLHKVGKPLAGSLSVITQNFVEYKNAADMVSKIDKELQKIQL